MNDDTTFDLGMMVSLALRGRGDLLSTLAASVSAPDFLAVWGDRARYLEPPPADHYHMVVYVALALRFHRATDVASVMLAALEGPPPSMVAAAFWANLDAGSGVDAAIAAFLPAEADSRDAIAALRFADDQLVFNALVAHRATEVPALSLVFQGRCAASAHHVCGDAAAVVWDEFCRSDGAVQLTDRNLAVVSALDAPRQLQLVALARQGRVRLDKRLYDHACLVMTSSGPMSLVVAVAIAQGAVPSSLAASSSLAGALCFAASSAPAGLFRTVDRSSWATCRRHPVPVELIPGHDRHGERHVLLAGLAQDDVARLAAASPLSKAETDVLVRLRDDVSLSRIGCGAARARQLLAAAETVVAEAVRGLIFYSEVLEAVDLLYGPLTVAQLETLVMLAEQDPHGSLAEALEIMESALR